MADALEDDYVASDAEYDAGDAADAVDGVEDTQNAPSSKKRKGEQSQGDQNGASSSHDQQNGLSEEEKRARKKQKMKQKDKAKKIKKAAANLAVEPGAVSRYPVDMQADHLRKLMRSCKHFSKMTDMELDEVGIAERMLVDSSSSDIAREKENLADFISQVVPKVAKSVRDSKDARTGEPRIVIVTGNAQRAADLARAVKSLLGTEDEKPASSTAKPNAKPKRAVAIAKLFARHFKVAEQVDFLSKHVCPVAVGTPQRIDDLIKQNALRLDKLDAIVLDASWADVKQRTMLDGLDTRQALFSLFAQRSIQSRLQASNGAKVALF